MNSYVAYDRKNEEKEKERKIRALKDLFVL